MLDPRFIKARDIPEAWFLCLQEVLRHGKTTLIDKGSYEGDEIYRRQLDALTLHITHPMSYPRIPEVPQRCGDIPPPTSEDYIVSYTPYIMSPVIAPNETYTYGSRLHTKTKHIGGFTDSALEILLEDLVKNPYSNQLTLSVSRPEDIGLDDPPCLRSVSLRYIYSKLNMITHWRCLGGSQPILYVKDTEYVKGTIEGMYADWSEGYNIKVFGYDQDSNEISTYRVVNGASRTAHDIIKIKTKDGSEIDVTPEHWLYVYREGKLDLVQVKDLKVKDKLVRSFHSHRDFSCDEVSEINLCELFLKHEVKRNYNFRNVPLSVLKKFPKRKRHMTDKRILPLKYYHELCNYLDEYTLELGAARSSHTHNYKLALDSYLGCLLGHWLANGWYRSNSIRIASGQQKVIEELKTCLKALNFNYSLELRGECSVFNVTEVHLKDAMLCLGFKGGSHDKRIPNIVYNAPYKFRLSLFNAWLQGDAGCTVSKKLSDDMRLLAALTGINTSVYKHKARTSTFPDGHQTEASPYYRTHVFMGENHRVLNSPLLYSSIKSISPIYQTGRVYDFTVKGANNLMVGPGQVLVHNSWDLWAGLPSNLGGLMQLFEYLGTWSGYETGEFIAFSEGAHVYSDVIPYVERIVADYTRVDPC